MPNVDEAMPKDDAWDWPLLMYVATVILRRSEKAFWRMSPRKLSALAGVHAELNGAGKKGKTNPNAPKQGYIDQIF